MQISLFLTTNMIGSIKRYLDVLLSYMDNSPNHQLFFVNRKLGHVIGIGQLQSSPVNGRLNLKSRVFIGFMATFAITSAEFFIFDAKTMQEFGISFIGSFCAICLIGAYLAMIRQKDSFWSFVESCERFIAKRENSNDTYRKLIENINRLCALISVASWVSLSLISLPFLCYSYFNYYIIDLGADSFFLFYPVKWPFDWRTPLGYLVAAIVEHIALYCFNSVYVWLVDLVSSTCWLLIVMVDDIIEDLAAFKRDVKANKNRELWMQRFTDIVQFHSDAKELVAEFNTVIKYSLFAIICTIMSTQTSVLVTLQFQSMDGDTKIVEILVSLTLAAWVYVALFFVCEFGQRVTNQFELFGEELEQCDWDTLPIEMQRMYVIFLSGTQQPVNVACYFNVLCTREIFQTITNKTWSYFNTARQFGE